MSTQKPLRSLVPSLNEYIKSNVSRLNHSAKLQNIFEGQLLTYLLAVLKSELSERAYSRIIPRVVPINVLIRIINKLSKLYSLPVTREASNDIDQDIMDVAVDEGKINTTFGLANKLFSLHQYLALEPYYHNNKIKTRVLDPSQFLIYTDDLVSREMTVFLKYMGQLDETGKQLWFAYSDEEFLAFDTDNLIRTEYMEDNQGINPYEKIPFIYVNQYSTKLMPQLDSDIIEMTLRIPQLLSDLNYAHKFQAHSMVYGIDLDPETKIDGSPDGFSLFNSREGEGKNGTIDFLKPQVEIEASLKLVTSELGLWLESKGIKAGTVGEADASLSGIAKILDEADTSSARAEQVDVFAYMEDDYWKLYSILHNYHINDLEDKRGMTDIPLTSIKFAEQKPLEDEKAKIEKIAIKLQNKLTSRRRAVMEANPELDEDQIDELIAEIDSESVVTIAAPSFIPDNTDDTEE